MSRLILTIVGLFLAAGPQDAFQVVQPTAEVRGKVVDKQTGRPLSGAIVSLYREGGTEKTSVTDDGGAFQFNALEPGRYWGGVLPGRFATAVRPAGDRRRHRQRRGSAGGRRTSPRVCHPSQSAR